jgi:hypothetical protein
MCPPIVPSPTGFTKHVPRGTCLFPPPREPKFNPNQPNKDVPRGTCLCVNNVHAMETRIPGVFETVFDAVVPASLGQSGGPRDTFVNRRGSSRWEVPGAVEGRESQRAQRHRGAEEGQSYEGTKIVSRFPPFPHRGRPGGGASALRQTRVARHAPVPVTIAHHHAAPARPRQGKPRMSESPTQSSATMHNARPTPPGPKSRMSQSCSARVLFGVGGIGVATWIACVGGGDQVIRL